MKSSIVGLAFATVLAVATTAAQETMTTGPRKNSVDKQSTAAAAEYAKYMERRPALKGSRRKLEEPLSTPGPTPPPFSFDYDDFFDDDFSFSYTF